MDEDRFRDAMVQAVSGGEGNLIRCEVEVDIVSTEPGYSQDYGI